MELNGIVMVEVDELVMSAAHLPVEEKKRWAQIMALASVLIYQSAGPASNRVRTNLPCADNSGCTPGPVNPDTVSDGGIIFVSKPAKT